MKKPMIGIISLILILLSACSKNNIYEKGFAYENHITSPLAIAVKSDKKVHNIENFSLDFYFGSYNEIAVYSNEDYQIVSFGLYLSNDNLSTDNHIGSGVGLTDYKIIEDAIFFKEISFATFNTDKYIVNMNIFGKVFNHHEIIDIPETILIDHEGFILTIIDIVYDKGSDMYSFGQNSIQISIHYTHIKNQSIELK